MSHRSISWAVVVVLLTPVLLWADAREWTDKQGNTLRAEFVRIHGSQVILTNGARVRSVPYMGLSEEDQEYLKDLLRKQRKNAEVTQLEALQEAAERAAAGAARAAENGADFSSPPSVDSSGAPPVSDFAERSRQATEERLQNIEDMRQRQAEEFAAKQEQQAEQRRMQAEEREAQRQLEEQERDEQRQQYEQQREEQQLQREEMLASTGDNMPGYSESMMEKVCGECNRIVPSHLSVGDKCPHCGVRFDYDETTGERSYSSSGGRIPVRGIVTTLILICGGLAALARKIFG